MFGRLMRWIKRGILVVFFLVAAGTILISLAPRAGRPYVPGSTSASAPATPIDDGSFKVGDRAILAGPDTSGGVQIAATAADVADLAEAARRIVSRVGPHPGEMSSRLYEAKRVRLVAKDARVEVIASEPGKRRVKVHDEDGRRPGMKGWVPLDWLRPSGPSQ